LTPNPCIVCNKEIKFGLFLEKALKQKADFIATGHYARTKDGRLLKAKDKEKDQSYFLWRLSQKQLKKVIFPIGVHARQEVEKMAKKFKLPFAGVRKSQEICFIPGTVGEFLKNNLKSKPGQIINTRGDVLGKHQALHFYTIGQRKGIELSGGPYYVLDKDFKKNVLIVTKNERDLFKKELYIRQVNWLIGKKPVFPLKINAKIRYRQKASSAKIFKKSKSEFYRLVFDKAQRAVTPGQSVVFYQGSEVLGGGIISFY
jgi:tRNA-specific 2-thiouridylase